MSTQTITVPGSGLRLHYRRDDRTGRLQRLTCAGTPHVSDDGETCRYGDGLAVVTERTDGTGVTRDVEGAGISWSERYEWDEHGLLSMVDGVRVLRDQYGRITACVDTVGGTTWHYGYAGTDLTVVDAPDQTRHVTYDPAGRPVLHRVGGDRRPLDYDADGSRRGVAAPHKGWHRDRAGRLWTVTRPDGSVRTTYLWDGARCFGRIDGPPDQPLAAVFSVDPSGTPVRVITPRRVHRIPRDAYGEGLLAHPGVPGLFGGATHRRLVYLPARILDPRLGAFTAPDPYDGGLSDPRRLGGQRGDLPVQGRGAGRYAACRHDPVGWADPTGAIAWWLPLSDLTWSWQNNVLATFGLDLTVNFWASLFTGKMGEWGSTLFRGVSSSDRLGSYALARDGGLGFDRAFTYQHVLLSSQSSWDELREARCVVPAGRFVPELRGSLLRIAPATGNPAVFRGDGTLPGVGTLLDWSRAGGTAEPALPGSPVPWFPTGGVHLNSTITRLAAEQDATLDELGPIGAPVTGTIAIHSSITLLGTGLGLVVGSLVALVHDSQVVVVDVTEVNEGDGTTTVRLGSQPSGPTTGVRLRGLGPVAGAEPRGQGHTSAHLDGAGATLPYAAGDVLRLSRAGTVQGSVLVTGFEARLTLEAALPATLIAPLVVNRTDATPVATNIPVTLGPGPAQFTLPAGAAAPGVGAVLVVSAGAARRAAVVTAVTGTAVTVDGDIAVAPPAGLGAPGAPAVVASRTVGAELGTRTFPPEAAPTLTYAATAPNQAPGPADAVLATDAAGRRVARLVTARDYDDIALGGPLPFPDAAVPYDPVERFTPTALDQAITVDTAQTLTSGVALAAAAAGAVALRIEQYQATTTAEMLASGATPVGGPVTVVDETITVAGGPPNATPRPGQVVALTRAAEDPELAVVRAVRLTVLFDRPLDAAATGLGDALQLTPLEGTGPVYTATRLDPHLVTARPLTDAGERTQLARIRAGEMVEVSWELVGAPGRLRRHFAVSGVDGATLTLHASAPGLPAAGAAPGDATNFQLRRLTPARTDHGSPRIGLAGTRDAANPSLVTVSVWAASTYNGFVGADTPLAVSDGVTAVPAVPVAVNGWALELGADAQRLTGPNVTVLVPAPAQAVQFNPSFVAVGADAELRDPVPVTPLPVLSGGLLCVVTGFGPTGVPDTAVAARLSPGTVRVPEADESFEISREQSLIDHELTHTRQSAAWGPLLLAWGPLWAFQLGAELRDGVEAPEFSPYLTATISKEPFLAYKVTINSPGSTTFAPGDEVELSYTGSVPRLIRLGESAGTNTYIISDGPIGEVSIRKVTSTPAWDGVLGAMQFLTHGGILNAVAGTVWGGVFWALARGFALLASLFATTTKYKATVVDTQTLELKLDGLDERDREKALLAFRNVDRITVHMDGVLVRPLTRESEPPVLKLAESIFYTGEITIAPYRTTDWGSLLPWNDYFPATVTDLNRPAAIQVHPVGTKVLELHVHDMVEVARRYDTVRTHVTHVGNDGNVELSDPVLVDEELRIAKISEQDPVGWMDSWVMERLGMGWLRWVFDPWGNLAYRTHPAPGSNAEIVARVARHVMSTQSWSAVIPGYFIWFNLIHQPDNGHRSPMEQDASEQSGDLYSPIGRLHAAPSVVGDVGRYWYFSGSRLDSLVAGGQRDNRGVHLETAPRVMPLRTAETATTSPPPLNRGAAAPAAPTAASPDTPAIPGGAVPDALVRKAADPREPDQVSPRSFAASDAGWIPLTPETERSCGIYVAFCRPSGPDPHRITLEDGIPAAVEASDAHGRGIQPVFYEPTVLDVTVTVGGVTVAEGATISLVRTQQARLAVAVPPAGGGAPREHVLTTLRPAGDPVLRTDGTILSAQDQNTVDPEPAEVSRIYRVGADGTYASGGLAGQRIHGGADLHVPIRSFSVTVTDVLPVRSAAAVDPDAPDANAVTEVDPGATVFVLVPASVCEPLAVELPATYPDGTAMDLAPQVSEVNPLPAGLGAFLGDGQAYQVTFPPDQNPHQQIEIPMRVNCWLPQPGMACTDPGVTDAVLRASVVLRRT